MAGHRAHSDTFKQKVVDAAKLMKHKDVAKQYRIHGSLITRWKKELETGQEDLENENPENENPAPDNGPPLPFVNTEPEVFNDMGRLMGEIHQLREENRLLKKIIVDIVRGNY